MKYIGKHSYNGWYTGQYLNHVAFPLGGIGAGMVCLEGIGGFSHVSLWHRPQITFEPVIFATLSIQQEERKWWVRVLEGPIPERKISAMSDNGFGGGGRDDGLPRMKSAKFKARFPFAYIHLSHPHSPVSVRLTGWSPFIPGNIDDSSLPVAACEYEFVNKSKNIIQMIFGFHTQNFLLKKDKKGNVYPFRHSGLILRQFGTPESPEEEGAFGIWIDDPHTFIDSCWFRGGWFDSLTMLWRDLTQGNIPTRPAPSEEWSSPGGSLYLPVTLSSGERKKIRVLFAWYVPFSKLRVGGGDGEGDRRDPSHYYRPWYSSRWSSLEDVMNYWIENYSYLCKESVRFRDCFFRTTLPPEVIEAISANLTILKSPTILRQWDGRIWGWEGCGCEWGCCHGTCTHVWNYAQALPHLFPGLERKIRETELIECQNEEGHQVFRAPLPIRTEKDHSWHAAADGQLGGILKVYREWKISGDDQWLRSLWPRVKKSLHYAIQTWDPDRQGVLVEPHHNTYDIEFWGPDGMCSSIYLAALKVATILARYVGEENEARDYEELYQKGRVYVEQKLFNGEYFKQEVIWKGLRVGDPIAFAKKGINQQYSPEALEILAQEGPKYQYGEGCLADGVIGAWLAWVCGVDEDVLDPEKVRSHFLSVYRYNFFPSLKGHANSQRPFYALEDEGGVVLCTWPRGGRPSIPFPYCDESWTGFEYEVASYLIKLGEIEKGLSIVRAVRDRYDGRRRNPFDEYECGHWYARALSSYALLQAFTGAWYDPQKKILTLRPCLQGDFEAFFACATGYGTIGIKKGKPFLRVCLGSIPVQSIQVIPYS